MSWLTFQRSVSCLENEKKKRLKEYIYWTKVVFIAKTESISKCFSPSCQYIWVKTMPFVQWFHCAYVLALLGQWYVSKQINLQALHHCISSFLLCGLLGLFVHTAPTCLWHFKPEIAKSIFHVLQRAQVENQAKINCTVTIIGAVQKYLALKNTLLSKVHCSKVHCF